jgi:ribosomal protein S28E/S33
MHPAAGLTVNIEANTEAIMKPIFLAALFVTASCAQLTLPEGTKLRVRLDQTISSATAEEGQIVELNVTEPIKIGDVTVIAEGARATGTITEAQGKRRMGRAGKLDFSIDRVKSTDNQWVPLRYTITKKSGESHSVRTGVITAGVAVAFLPAAPVMLLMKGKDITINKGVGFDVFTDSNHVMGVSAAPSQVSNAAGQSSVPPQFSGVQNPAATGATATGTATVTVTSTIAGAEIEVDGAFVGNTPTTLQLSPGTHRFVVKANGRTWERPLQVSAGSSISVNAPLK